MYYYIMEPAGKKGLVWQEKVKDLLGDLGIAGETVSPTPARTIEELTHLGIVKGYSTIVAVGSENLVNKVATTIINQKESSDVVLGIIPEDYESRIAKKINVSDLKTACSMLKYRKLKTIDVGLIEPNKYFITEATIESNRSVEAYLSTSEIKAGIKFNEIIVKPGLEIIIHDASGKSSGKNIFNWLFGVKKVENDIFSSYFRSKKFKIETINASIPIKVEAEVVAKTPVVFQTKPKALKIIVARDIIEAKE